LPPVSLQIAEALARSFDRTASRMALSRFSRRASAETEPFAEILALAGVGLLLPGADWGAADAPTNRGSLG